MKKTLSYLISMIFIVLVGCSSEAGKNVNGAPMKINEKLFSYDYKLIVAIDKTQWIDTANPPTVKGPKPEREPQFLIEILNETYTLWDTGNSYLISIEKKGENYWLALDGEEYVKAKKQTDRYKNVEIDYPLSIDTVAEKIRSIHPSPVIYVEEVEPAFQIPSYEQKRYCIEKKNECIYFYSGEKVEDALIIKNKLADKLALSNMLIQPKIYSVKNMVIMYIPRKAEEYILDKDIKNAIKLLEN